MNEKLRARTSESTYLMYSAVRCARRSIRSLRFSSRLSSGEPADVCDVCAETMLNVAAAKSAKSDNFFMILEVLIDAQNVANFRPAKRILRWL